VTPLLVHSVAEAERKKWVGLGETNLSANCETGGRNEGTTGVYRKRRENDSTYVFTKEGFARKSK